jgi:MFS family permease
MAPLMVGLVSTSVVTGRLITRTGRYKRYPIIGTALAGVAFVLLSTMDVTTTRVEVGAYMAVLGIGLGMIMQNLILVAQNDAPAKDLGVVTATVGFARTLGGSVGTAVFGTIMAAGLTARLRGALPADAEVDPDTVQGAPQTILAMDPEVRDAVVTAFSGSISNVFVAVVPLALLALVLMWLIPEKPLRTTAHVGSARGGAARPSGLGPAPGPSPDLDRRRRMRRLRDGVARGLRR